MNKAAPFVHGSNDNMKRGFSRFGQYVVPPHAHKLHTIRFMQKISRKSSSKKTQKEGCMRRMELAQAMNIIYICMNDILRLLIIKLVALDVETRPDIRF